MSPGCKAYHAQIFSYSEEMSPGYRVKLTKKAVLYVFMQFTHLKFQFGWVFKALSKKKKKIEWPKISPHLHFLKMKKKISVLMSGLIS